MAVADYASTSDFGSYAPDVDTVANASIIASLLHDASRYLDHELGNYFYNDGVDTKYWDMTDSAGAMQGGPQVTTAQPFFPTKSGTIAAAAKGAISLTYTVVVGPAPAVNDVLSLDHGAVNESVTVTGVTGTGPYTLSCAATSFAHGANAPIFLPVQVQIFYYENQALTQILTLNGDGVTPPSNWYAWPRNPRKLGNSTVDVAKPWWGINLAHVPMGGTQFLPIAIGGYATVGITASWGWPAVPDVVKNLVCRMVVRAWRAREIGHKLESGSPEFGVVNWSKHFDERDLSLLVSSDLLQIAL